VLKEDAVMVVVAVGIEPSSAWNSLLSGKTTEKSAETPNFQSCPRPIAAKTQRLAARIPCAREQGIFPDERGKRGALAGNSRARVRVVGQDGFCAKKGASRLYILDILVGFVLIMAKSGLFVELVTQVAWSTGISGCSFDIRDPLALSGIIRCMSGIAVALEGN
jgi:hypothetical protein